MDRERQQQIERLYQETLQRASWEREKHLADACKTDTALLREVQALLRDRAAAVAEETETQVASSTPLRVGSQIGVYRIEAPLGSGGMGVVYRALDTKLDRLVALKVLPEQFSQDEERVKRFEREAKMLAALNHPNIAMIHGMEESGGTVYLLMEFVPGENLARKLSSGQVDMDEGLRYGAQIAAALESAHERGIIHRDLKPANVNITPEGRVKLLDFGLARSFERTASEGSDAETITEEMTRSGKVLGTAAYMSPEQARGKELDKRTDIWSFGCVLYEVLARRKAFRGQTSSEYITAILSQEPDWEALPASTPENVQGILVRCLEKDPMRRLRDIGEARIELENAVTGAATARTGTGRRLTAARTARRGGLGPWAALALGMLICAIGFVIYLKRSNPPAPLARFGIELGAGESIPPTHSSQVAFSPDGRFVAYGATKLPESASPMAAMPAAQAGTMASPGGMGSMPMGQSSGTGMGKGPPMPSMPSAPMPSMGSSSMPAMSSMMGSQIYIRPIDQQAAWPIEGGVGDAPFFSPDSKWLGFWDASTRSLRKVALSGGAPVKICDAVSGVSGAAWGPDGTIVFAWFDLFRVPAAGGPPKVLLKVDEKAGERFYRHPSFLPGGKAILFTISNEDTESYDNGRIAVLSLETGEKKIVLEGGSSARYSPSGHLVYARGGKLLAAPFNLRKLQVTGPPVPVLDGVFMSSDTGMAAFSISTDGSLVYAVGGVEGGQRVPVWVDRKGGSSPLPLPLRSYLHPRLSPDERQLAIEVEGPAHDFYDYDFSRGVLTKLSFDGASHWPMWTPKGDRITFRSWKTGTMTMWWMPADRSSPPELLTNIGSMQSPESWSPDGKNLAFTQMDEPQNGSDVYVLPMEGDRRPRAVLKSRFVEGSPKFSPDGKWLSYSSDESGRAEVYAMAYPGPGPTVQISTSGGTDPVWRPKGGEIYYRNGDQMMAVTITDSSKLAVSKPAVLWQGHYLAGVGSSCGMSGPTSANYDVSADGQRFLMIEDKAQDVVGRQLQLIPGWSGSLK
jgi:Tol biopolymer transport system component